MRGQRPWKGLCFFLCVYAFVRFVAIPCVISLEVPVSLGSQCRLPTAERCGPVFSGNRPGSGVLVIDGCASLLRLLVRAVAVFCENLFVRPSPRGFLKRDIDLEVLYDCVIKAAACFVIAWTFRSL